MHPSFGKFAILLAFLLMPLLHGGALGVEAEASAPIDIDLADAGTIQDAAARLAKIDEILDRYGDSENEYVMGRVIKAKMDKARLTVDATERRRLYDECIPVLEKVFAADPRNANNLGAALLNRAELESDGAKRKELLNRVVERLTAPEQAAMTANAMRQLADAAPTPEEKLRRYNEVIERFSEAAVPDSRLARDVVESLVAKAGLLTERSEQLAVLDMAISRYGETRDPVVRGRVAKARLEKALLVPDNEEKKRLLDECISELDGIPQPGIRDMHTLGAALLNRAALESDAAEREKLLKRAAESQNSDVAVKALEMLSDGAVTQEDRIRYYDQVMRRFFLAKTPENLSDMLEVTNLELKVKMAPDPAQRLEAINEMLGRYNDTRDRYIQGRVIKIKLDKAELASDKAEKRRLYDEVIPLLEKLLDVDLRNSYNLGIAILNRAEMEDDVAERAKLLNQAVEKLPLPLRAQQVARAMRMLADDAPGVEEKIRRYDEVIRRFSGQNSPGDHLRWEIAQSLNSKSKLVSGPAEKQAIYEQIIDTYGGSENPYVMGQVAWAMLQKARLLDNDEEKIALYDKLVDTYENVDNEYLASCVESAFRRRLQLAGDEVDKTDFYDKRLAGLPESAPAKKIAALRYHRAGAAGDDAEKLRRYDEVAASYRDEADPAVARYAIMALQGKAKLLDSAEEKAAVYDDIVASFGESEDASIRHQVFDALDDQARSSSSDEEKIRIYNAIVERFENDTDGKMLQAVTRAMQGKARLDGDVSRLLAHQDRILALSDEPEIVSRALATKAENVTGKKEKEKYYTQIIERFSGSDSKSVIYRVADAYMEKADLTDNKTQQNALYDAIVALYRRSPELTPSYLAERALIRKTRNTGETTELERFYDDAIAKGETAGDIARAMVRKAQHLDNKTERVALYDAILEKYGNNDERNVRGLVAEAILAKAEIVEDAAEKIRLYDLLIDNEAFHTRQALPSVVSAFENKAKLVGEHAEKIELLDRLLAIETKFNVPYLLFNTMKDKADLLADPGKKMALYDEILEKFATVQDDAWMYAGQLDAIRLARADLVEDKDERLRRYDELLNRLGSSNGRNSHLIAKVLKKKEELTGDASVQLKYYDAQAAAAPTELERANAWMEKIRAMKMGPEQTKATVEMVELFIESKDKKVRRLTGMAIGRIPPFGDNKKEQARLYDLVLEKYADDDDPELRSLTMEALLNKATRATDTTEKLRLYDTVIAKSTQDDNGDTAVFIVRAKLEKAKLMKNTDEQIRHLEEIIESHKTDKQYFVKSLVDEAIARRFRLQDENAASYDSREFFPNLKR